MRKTLYISGYVILVFLFVLGFIALPQPITTLAQSGVEQDVPPRPTPQPRDPEPQPEPEPEPEPEPQPEPEPEPEPEPQPEPDPQPEPEPEPQPQPQPQPPLKRSGGGGGGGNSSRPNPSLRAETSVVMGQVGEIVTFTIYVSNDGDGTAEQVVVTDKLPPFLSLEAVTSSWGEVTMEGNTAIVTIGKLLPEDQVTIHIHAHIVSYAIPPYNVDTVVLSSDGNDQDQENNRVSFVVWTFGR